MDAAPSKNPGGIPARSVVGIGQLASSQVVNVSSLDQMNIHWGADVCPKSTKNSMLDCNLLWPVSACVFRKLQALKASI